MKNEKKFTVDEVFEEINKLNSEEKVALLKNTNLYNVVQLMNEPDQYKGTLEAIDSHVNTWINTKSVLKKLNGFMITRDCQKLVEEAKAFVPPDEATVMPGISADNFARMVNVIMNVTMKPVEECARIVYDVITRISCLNECQNNYDLADEDIVKSTSVLNQLNVDIAKTPFDLFTVLNNKKETYDSLSLNAIAKCLAGNYNAEYCMILIDKWLDVFNPISLGKVVESVYSIKETTDTMNRYFAELNSIK
ncbi:hypothetical protein [Lacrimispora celerecrescens]|uniref:Uncharacterized protein n=1 Tax=Lacrimispora celerecrescens TaxID=29354 RepID=A0A084JMB7_9FIRM|nr:hypothetical protein [Lacrimispora celerecrescens]KEZ90101.1 hypothetical protein IO98_11455 [Lacrimispora celerecrescens]